MTRRLLLPSLATVLLCLTALSACSGQMTASPTPSATQKLTTEEVAQRAIAKCLNSSGWTVTYDPRDNSISSSTAPSQQSKFNAAYKKCDAPYEKKQVSLSQLSQAQWHSLYSQETKTATCLRSLGVTIPQIPAYQTFVDRYQSQSPWTSYSFIGSPPQGKYYEYLAKCPQPYIPE